MIKTEMEQIVELLRQSGMSEKITDEEIMDKISSLNKQAVQRPPEVVKECPKIVTSDDDANIVYSSGFVFTIDKIGNTSWSYDGKDVGEDSAKPNLDKNELQVCLQHIIGLHLKEKRDLWALLLGWKEKAEEIKLRYIKGDTKKAFVAGMIMGKKNS